uniref:Squamosa promoter-binding-like protein 7-like n=1 Tax=Tetraselmis sp. GSL018 TaxID=582737 RepID=A0A061RYR4_9CHLO
MSRETNGGEGDGGTNWKQKLKCQYPDCQADLTKLKRFNLRCRICEEHCKALSVDINGEPHRFCQQCNKFHPLSAFDKDKRGCRVKLEKHNKRRRAHRRNQWKKAKGLPEDNLTQESEEEEAPGSKHFRPTIPHFGPVSVSQEADKDSKAGIGAAINPGGFTSLPGSTGNPSMDAYLAQLSQHASALQVNTAAAAVTSAPPVSLAPGMIGPPPPGQLEAWAEGAVPHPPPGSTAAAGAGGPPGQSLQQYMLLAAYAAYMAGYPT